MRPSAFLRTLSMKIPARSSASAIAPWPLVRSSFDGWLDDELETLLVHREQYSYSSARWLTSALETAVATQKMTMESILASANQSSVAYANDHDSGREAIDDYLEDVVELLDSCNRLRERRETVEKYIDSLKTVLHYLEGKCDPNATVLGRARTALDSCELMERRCAMLDKCSSGLRKLAEKIIAQGGITCGTASKKLTSSSEHLNSSELQRVLSASKAIAILTCGVFDISLSFKSKRGLPAMDQSGNVTLWSNTLSELHKELKEAIEKRRRSSNVVFNDQLRQAVDAAKSLRSLINSGDNEAMRGVEFRTCVRDLRKACEDLEEGIRPFEGRINELYRGLISIRVALLDLLSQA